ncbi:MAG: hypoxanthine-guanine phosphoribosyltransferase [Gammaproteobacteria bacterium]|nr:hypoxanthine-guanine phosphoribosyltransferase [Gammaproteobacteria bacterium]MBU1414949.1 hypoxanthine-guanine phosphoribosyltransferase [Gammaproteobacteria bacterium]
MTPADAHRILSEADLVYSAAEVASAIERLATEITARLEDSHPLVLTVMGGGIVFAGQLLPCLPFPLEVDYLHVTRYGQATSGGELRWMVEPGNEVAGRVVLVLDDILDEGVTMAAIKARLMAQGVRECLVAVLSEKETGRAKPVRPEFVGLRLPNRYVFGCGMDIGGAWRNLPAIYAVKGL